MKTREGFISNSSSTSFAFIGRPITFKQALISENNILVNLPEYGEESGYYMSSKQDKQTMIKWFMENPLDTEGHYTYEPLEILFTAKEGDLLTSIPDKVITELASTTNKGRKAWKLGNYEGSYHGASDVDDLDEWKLLNKELFE
jgi:hypothetical protein